MQLQDRLPPARQATCGSGTFLLEYTLGGTQPSPYPRWRQQVVGPFLVMGLCLVLFSPGARLEEDEEYITRFIPSFLSTNSTSSTSANLTSLVNSPSSTTTCLLSTPNGQHCLRPQLNLSFLPSRLFCVVGLETTLLSRRLPPPRPQS